jgi:uncharacterized membrane protein (UPF0182 family)
MRRPTDLPRRRAFGRVSGRIVLIVVAVLLFFLIIFGRALARFYVDYLWHDSLGRSDVFWGVLWTKVVLFLAFLVLFLVLAGLNLYIADRTAPKAFPANVHPYVERFHELFGHRLRLVRYCTAAVLALFLALPAAGHWQDWLLFRNSTPFGVQDAQFGADVGFYVFELPFISFVVDWLFAAMVVVLLLTLAAHLLNGGVIFASSTPSVRPATKSHLAVLLAVLATLKAADYWLTRYQLTNERRGFVQGATYAVVNAQLPALMLLVLIALLTAALFLSTIRTNRWRVPLVASGLWLVVLLIGGLIFPALVQSLVVRPNQADREAPYIARNVTATRQAMGLDDVIVEEVSFGTLTAAEVESDLSPLRDVRLLNPVEMKSRFRVDEGQVAGLAIDDLDVDRYTLDGQLQEVLIAARELDLGGSANQSWQGRHLANTRGCGVVLAPASRVTSTDRPDYQDIELTRPELYFSPSLTSYAIARTDTVERECGDDEIYEGTRGVRMSSFARRAAFALAFLDYNVVGSGAINPDSQMLWVRDVRDRVAKLAPFLSFDGDPYPVVIDGAVTWVLDGYTSTGSFPYAQRIGNVELTANSGIPRDANYVRNSVKATVDAYDGSVTFYVADDDDPILRAWRSAFPDLFEPIAEMPSQLRDHLRYPEDLFRAQTDLYSKYQLPAESFFQREGAWSVAQAPSVAPRVSTSSISGDAEEEITSTEFATESEAARFVPYYTLFRNRVTGRSEFVLLRPFVPFSRDDLRTELQAYMTASSDPQSYGRLTAYVVEGELPEGPLRVSSQAETEPLISREISLQDNEESGTQVRFGDMQLVPIGDGLVFVRPFYIEVQQQGSQIPVVTEYRFVIVSYNEQAVHAASLSEAFALLFPGFDADVGDRVPDPAGEEVPDDSIPDDTGSDDTGDTGDEVEPERPPLDESATAADLLAEAEALFTEAEAGLRANGDLGAYQQRVDEARALVARALDLIEEG